MPVEVSNPTSPTMAERRAHEAYGRVSGNVSAKANIGGRIVISMLAMNAPGHLPRLVIILDMESLSSKETYPLMIQDILLTKPLVC